MFVDVAKIYTKGGDGGRGSNSMRREKYVPEGGPYGGDGGKGGDVVVVVETGLNTLVDFKYQKHFKAERGEHGMSKGMYGKAGEEMILKVPPGTVIKDDDTGEILADMTDTTQRVVVARGGRGGRGNMKFQSMALKAPTFYEKGEPGEERWLVLELKVIADVGLVGFPNAGKSTLLSRVSAARPKIANYPFTTLNPHLGVVEVADKTVVFADIPGLIEGASEGVGLGHEFLRHVERTKVLVHVLDGAATEGRDPLQDFYTINRELELYNEKLAARPMVVAVNKMDLPDAQENLKRISDELTSKGYKVFAISGVTGEGLRPLLFEVAHLVETYVPPEEDTPLETERIYRAEDRLGFDIHRLDGDRWEVRGKEIERLVAMTHWENEEAIERFQQIFQRMGIEKALRKAGADDGHTVEIQGIQFELNPEM